MSLNDSWRTPQDLFDVLDKGGVYQGIEFEANNFDIDLCATKENSKCDIFAEDYLIDWYEKISLNCNLAGLRIGVDTKTFTCFMNPPYSNPWPFIEKAWEDSKHCKIVLLLKVDTSTKWWSVFWEYGREDLVTEFISGKQYTKIYHGHKPGCQVIFLPKRVKFDPPIELINSGEVEKIGNKWLRKVVVHNDYRTVQTYEYKELSGPTFPSCIVIFDRRGLQ